MCRTGEIMVVCFEWWPWLEMGTPGVCCMFIELAFWGNRSIFLDEPPPSTLVHVVCFVELTPHLQRVWLLTVK